MNNLDNNPNDLNPFLNNYYERLIEQQAQTPVVYKDQEKTPKLKRKVIGETRKPSIHKKNGSRKR